MRKPIKLFLTFSLLFTLFVVRVNAECSYQERKELLNEAKNVDAFFEINNEVVSREIINPNTEEHETIEEKKYYLTLNVSNITNNFFIKVINNYDDKNFIINNENNNGYYSMNVYDIDNIITYNLMFYSTKDNCYAYNFYNKKVIKPKENTLYYHSVCTSQKYENSNYCKQFITKNFNTNIDELIINMNEEIKKESENTIENINLVGKIRLFIINYWYLLVIIAVIIMIIVFIALYRKRKNEL